MPPEPRWSRPGSDPGAPSSSNYKRDHGTDPGAVSAVRFPPPPPNSEDRQWGPHEPSAWQRWYVAGVGRRIREARFRTCGHGGTWDHWPPGVLLCRSCSVERLIASYDAANCARCGAGTTGAGVANVPGVPLMAARFSVCDRCDALEWEVRTDG